MADQLAELSSMAVLVLVRSSTVLHSVVALLLQLLQLQLLFLVVLQAS